MTQVFLLALALQLLCVSANNVKPKLTDFVGHLYSQSGEEGVLLEIFDIIGMSSRLAIEFGAWDGFHLSNTALFFSKMDWGAILIEADPERYNTLVKNVAHLPAVKPINSMVDIGENSLENILKTHGAYPTDGEVDLLSIDIDGNDYYVFESLATLRPRVVVCEYNPTFPAEVDMYGAYGSDNHMGSSISALNRIAIQKGYLLVSITPNNGIWVRGEYSHLFARFNLDINDMQFRDYQVMVVTDMNGKAAFVKRGKTELGAMPYGFDRVPYAGILHGEITQLAIDALRFEVGGEEARPDPSTPFHGTRAPDGSLKAAASEAIAKIEERNAAAKAAAAATVEGAMNANVGSAPGPRKPRMFTTAPRRVRPHPQGHDGGAL
jgi:hypothetical protein